MARSSKRAASASRAQEDLDAILRAHGLRRTTARATVLSFMQESARPLSHGDVAAALESSGLDRATVYRNLMDLAEAGILARSDLGDHVWRFEMKRAEDDDATAHPHFLCTQCGAVSCLPEGAVKIMASRKTPRAVSKGHVVVQLKGVCDTCA